MAESRADDRIRGGAPREDALRTFQEFVNRTDTIFSRDHWLLPKLDRLRELLHDPISGEEAAALLDVLYGRRYMKDLIEWLETEPMSWAGFFVYRKLLEEEKKRKRDEELRQADERWERGIPEPGIELIPPEERARMDAEDLVRARTQFLPKAKPCPRCGTPPEHLEWFRYVSRPSTWAYLCGRGGYKTRCKFCLQEVDFFVTFLN